MAPRPGPSHTPRPLCSMPAGSVCPIPQVGGARGPGGEHLLGYEPTLVRTTGLRGCAMRPSPPWLLPAAVGFALTRPVLCLPKPCGHLLHQPHASWRPRRGQLPVSTGGWSAQACTPRGRRKPAGETSRRLLVEAFPPQTVSSLDTTSYMCTAGLPDAHGKVGPRCCGRAASTRHRRPRPGHPLASPLPLGPPLASISFSPTACSLLGGSRLSPMLQRFNGLSPQVLSRVSRWPPNSLPFCGRQGQRSHVPLAASNGCLNSILCIHGAVGPEVTNGQTDLKT